MLGVFSGRIISQYVRRFPLVSQNFNISILKMGSAHVFASHLANGTGLVRGYTFPFQTDKHGIIAHV